MPQKYRLVTSLSETVRLGGARPDNCIIDPEAPSAARIDFGGSGHLAAGSGGKSAE